MGAVCSAFVRPLQCCRTCGQSNAKARFLSFSLLFWTHLQLSKVGVRHFGDAVVFGVWKE